MSCEILGSAGTTYQSCRDFSSVPTTCVRARSSTSTTLPLGPDARRWPRRRAGGGDDSTSTSTRSLCIAVPAALGEMSMAGCDASVVTTRPPPRRFMRMRPATRSSSAGSANRLSGRRTTRPDRTRPRNSRRTSPACAWPSPSFLVMSSAPAGTYCLRASRRSSRFSRFIKWCHGSRAAQPPACLQQYRCHRHACIAGR